MQQKAKSNSVVTHSIGAEGVLTFNVRGAGSFTFDPATASKTVIARAMLHGFIQRISDGAALSRDPETGLPATPEAKLERMRAIADHYASGTDDWNRKKADQARTRKVTDAALVISAIGEMKGWLDEAVRDWIKVTADSRGVTEKDLIKQLAAQPKVILKVAEIKERRAQGTVDTTLFDELMDSELPDGDEEDEEDTEDGEDA